MSVSYSQECVKSTNKNKLISIPKMSRDHDNKDLYHCGNSHLQVDLYKGHKLHQSYILKSVLCKNAQFLRKINVNAPYMEKTQKGR